MSRPRLAWMLCCLLLLADREVAAIPTIDAVQHFPAIPRTTELVSVQARVIGSAPAATVRWRVDGTAQFASTAMADADQDGLFEATISAQADGSVIEFFVDATDATGTRTWPVGGVGALLQIDNSHDPVAPWMPGSRPIHRAVLREIDRAALVIAPAGATFMGTLVTVDGTGEAVHYLCEFRSDSSAAPQSFSVKLSQPWNGRSSFVIQSRFPHAQAIGAAAFRLAGLPVAESVPVRFRLNGADLGEAGLRMFGSYARVEPVDGAWVARQFPLDPAGNLYRVDDSGPGTHGELAYETPPTAANYAETYFKITNTAANDYSDIIGLTDKLTNAPESAYRAELGAVLNVDQWLGYLALDALLGNVRDGLQNGRGTGFHLYRGGADPRFVLVPGALDTVFGLGENATGDATTRSIFSYENVAGLNRMMNHPDILPDYYAKLLALLETTFAHAALDEVVDHVAGGWVDAVTVQTMKDFITQRRANVSAQIPQTFSLAITTSAPDVEAIRTTTDGTAVVTGTFHVARVRSVRVNGQPATLHYRISGPNAAGTWSAALTSGLNRGMNVVTAKFFSGADGAGELVHQLSAELYYSGAAGTNVSGNIGVGNALSIFQYGSYPSTPGSIWKHKTDFTDATLAAFIASFGATWKDEGFDDATWSSGPTQIGYGDAPRDEQTLVTRVDYSTASGTQSGPVALFRNTFNIADVSALAAVGGEVKFDDSCAIYVNGTQVYRHSDLTANAPLTEYTETTTTLTRENATTAFSIPLARLQSGVNTIAVQVHQHDPGSGDLTFDLRLEALPLETAEVRWTIAGSPYRLVGDVTVPPGVTLVVEPGVSVFADHTTRLTVNGLIKVLGTAEARVRFSHLPGAPPQDDPREPGAQDVPPKWGGILLVDSLSPENVIRYADFVNAQPAPVEGSITVVRSECLVEHCSFRGTYLHGVYGKNCSLTVQDCHFPDVFPPGKEALGEVLDNLSEFVEVDSPPNDPGVVGRPEFLRGFPIGGHLRLYRNLFERSSGHNDLTDITAGKWGVTPVLDVQDNHFRGPTGDEHIDLNGDAYIAGNFFENCTKDIYTSDQGYANAISSDVGDPDTTVVVARNVFSHVDHAVNVKRGTGAIFEHNTVGDVNSDYFFTRGAFTQNVRNSALNFFIPEDSGRAGDGAYAAFNVFFRQADGAPFSRVFSWADMDLAGQPPKTTKVEMAHNFLDPALQDPVIGSEHPDNVFAPVWQPRLGDPQFVNRATRNYALLPQSPARGTAPFGLDYGATIRKGCYLGNVPPALTPSSTASIVVGGPGIFAFKWRLDGGPWSAPVEIAPGVFPRTGPTIRTATLELSGLADGIHTMEVIGQDFAGNWQTTPTTETWTVHSTLRRLVLNEIVADALAAPDTFELHNAGAEPLSLTGWFVTDDSAVPAKHALSGSIPASGFLTFSIAGLDLNAAGGTLQLYEGATLADSIAFGPQVSNLSIGRTGAGGTWTLCTLTPNAPNVAVALGAAGTLRFNEWLAVPGVRFATGWIELANFGSAPVALAGLRISNNFAGHPAAYVFPALSFIGAGGYLKLDATGSAGAGQLPFTLNAHGDTLHLSDGLAILDRVTFLSQTADVSMGRSAAGALAFFRRPTGGFVNSLTEPTHYPAWLAWHGTAAAADHDDDGLMSLGEFALGTDPHRSDAPRTIAATSDGKLTLVFALPENPTVPQGHGRTEVSYVVESADSLTAQNWRPLATKSRTGAWSGDVAIGAASDGFVAVTVRDERSVAAQQQRFMRLQMSWTP